MSVDGNLWYVKLADGDVERVTLDQLDEAFQGGQIDENNMVLAAGSDHWMRLADLLGLADATPPPPPPTPTPRPAMQPTFRAPAMQPAVTAARPMQPLGTMRPPAGMPVFPVASSLRPVSFDLSDQIDFGDVPFPRPSRKRWVVGVLGTALVLGAGAFFAVTRTAGSASADTAPPTFAAAAALPSPAETTPPAPVTPATPTPPQAANAGPSSVMDPTQHLTNEQRQKLLDADKKVKSHPKTHGGGGGGGSVSSSASKSKSTTFTTSGNKYDPLNSSL